MLHKNTKIYNIKYNITASASYQTDLWFGLQFTHD